MGRVIFTCLLGFFCASPLTAAVPARPAAEPTPSRPVAHFEAVHADEAWQAATDAKASPSRHEKALRELQALADLPDADVERLLGKAIPALADPAHREAAVAVLSGLGDRAQAAKPKLIETIAVEKNLGGRHAAIDALIAMGTTAADYPALRKLLARQTELAPETARYLRTLLGENQTSLSSTSQEALAKLRAHEIDPGGLLKHEDPKVREEAVDALAATDELDAVTRERVGLLALRDDVHAVRAAGVRLLSQLSPSVWLAKVLPLVGTRDHDVRAAACECIEANASALVDKRAAIRARLIETMRRYPNEAEHWQHSVATAWRTLGLDRDDVAPLRSLLDDKRLGPARRAQVIQLIAGLGDQANVFLPALHRIADSPPQAIPVSEQWSRLGVDGDITAAKEALKRIPSPST